MLNDLKIKQLKASKKAYRVADHSGLCIGVRITGGKFWRYRYHHLNTPKMLTIGQYPEISLAYARSKVLEYREQLAKGSNPILLQKKELDIAIQASLDSFKTIALEFCHSKKNSKSKDWFDTQKRYLKKDINPVIGRIPIKDVDSSHIKTILDNAMQRIMKSGRGTGEVKAILVRQIIDEIMRYAIITKRITHDPTYVLRRYIQRPDIEHAKPLESIDKKKVMSCITHYGGTKITKNVLETLIYTMLRSIEIRRGRKEYINFEDKIWTIPIASKAQIQAGQGNVKRIEYILLLYQNRL